VEILREHGYDDTTIKKLIADAALFVDR
jgi:hypothetical protein